MLRRILRVRSRRIAGVQVRRGVLRREQDQDPEELLDQVLLRRGKLRVAVALQRRLPSVAKDDFLQVDAAAVVPVRSGRGDTPERFRQELPLDGVVEVAFVER